MISRKKEVKDADANIESIINTKRDEIFAEIRKPTDEKYANLHGELDVREQKDKTRDEAPQGKRKSSGRIDRR